jgi:DNA mismatch repair protein MutL
MNLETEHSRINLLPEHLIDQIKAGEVVERPANVLKELLENSIDAGSSKIKVTIKENGLDLIAIEDDGDGMFFDEIPYAFCRHATSKIENFEDIYRLNTFGFRGEALASISSVSRISCHSCPKENPSAGGKLVIHGAQTIEHAPYKSSDFGTSIYVRDLFFNTPVRLKFVKSKISERNALKKVVNAFIISNPHIHFSISWDDLDREVYTPVENKTERINDLISKSRKTQDIVSHKAQYISNNVECYISKTSTKGKSGKHHYLFVNNRMFSDKKIHQIVIRNLEKFWGYGMTGHYVINITVPENEIDVNVHPNKILIKFLNETEVFSLISATLKQLIEEYGSITNEQSQELDFADNSPLNQIIHSSYWEGSSNNSTTPVLDRSSFGQAGLFELESSNSIHSLGDGIFIYQLDSNVKYFLDVNPLFICILEKLNTLEFIEQTPLLISEPIEFDEISNEEVLLERLVNLGFELDRIDPKTLVVRSIPKLFERINYAMILEGILSNNCKSYENIDMSKAQINSEDIVALTSEFSVASMVENKIITKVNTEKIRKMLYGK